MIGPRPAPPPALALFATLTSDPELEREAAEEFAAARGGVDLVGPALPFDQTRYYEAEMGPGLRRTYRTCRELVPCECLPDLKATAWTVERRYQRQGQRRVNLDPGYLDLSKVVLASHKDGPQKLYLGGRVWADLVLYFVAGSFQPLSWTFPDLRRGPHLDFFLEARQRYKELLRAWRRDVARLGNGDKMEPRPEHVASSEESP